LYGIMSDKLIIPEERIVNKIILLREEKVMLDVHLAELYGIETRALKQAVRRNMDRFPADFMFELDEKEIQEVVSQNVIPSRQYLGGATPFAFTETGVAMLSSVLKSKRAVEMNVTIMRTFITLRKIALNYREIMEELNKMKSGYDKQFDKIFKVLEYLISPKNERTPIGFKHSKEDK
jgi:hypothetical protein